MTADSLPPFTPSLDWVRAKVGRTSADVYGAVLRYCQMGEGVCRAGLESIAQRAGVCRRTAITHLDRLVEFGLLVDETPNLRNHPHRYTVAECKPCTVQELHSAIPAPPQCNPCTPTVQELHYGSARIALEERDNPRDEEDTASPSPDLPDLSGMGSELDTLFGKKPGDTTAAVQEFKDAFPPGTVGDGQEMRPGATVPAHAPGSVDALRDALLDVLLPAARLKGLPGGKRGGAWQRAAATVTGGVFVRLPGANGKRGKLTVAHVRQGAQLWVARNHWRSEFSPCNENVRNGLTEAIQAVIDAGDGAAQMVEDAQRAARVKTGGAGSGGGEIPLADQMRMV
jgi:hypothetical protein